MSLDERPIERTTEQLSKLKETFPACPICENGFSYEDEICVANGVPSGAIKLSLEGFFGSQYDFGIREACVCDNCAPFVFALLKVFDMNDDWKIKTYTDILGSEVPKGEKLMALREKLMQAISPLVGR